VRLLTDDPPKFSKKAADFIDNNKDDRLIVNDLIVAEVIFVLESFYKVNKENIVKNLRRFFTIPQIVVQNESIIETALDFYLFKNIDYAEAYLAAYALKHRSSEIVSFDKHLDKLEQIKRIEP
jgi:predicted nucleic-acid-binding protein